VLCITNYANGGPLVIVVLDVTGFGFLVASPRI